MKPEWGVEPEWDDDDNVYDACPAMMWEPEPRTVMAELLGPDGEIISILLDRPYVPFGYTATPKIVQRWARHPYK